MISKTISAIAVLLSVFTAYSATPASDALKEESAAHLAALRKRPPNGHLNISWTNSVPEALAYVRAHADLMGGDQTIRDITLQLFQRMLRLNDTASGEDIARCLYESENAPGHNRIAAADYLATGLAAKGDFAAADALYAKLLEDPPSKLRANDRARAIAGRARLFTLREDKAGAIKCIEDARTAVPDADKAAMQAPLDKCVADVYLDFFDYRGALDYWLKLGNSAEAFAMLSKGTVSDTALCAKLARELVEKAPESFSGRNAWAWLWSRDEPFCRANLEAVLGKNTASTNAVLQILLRQFTGLHGNGYGVENAAYHLNYPLVTRTWALYDNLRAAVGAPVEFDAAQYSAIAFAGLRDREKAAAVIEAGLANEKLAPEERYQFELMRALPDLTGDESEIAMRLKAVDDRLAGDLDEKPRRARFERAGAFALLFGDDSLARGIARHYKSRYDVLLPKREYTVRFSRRPVAGIGGWDNLPFAPEESRFERKYGGGGLEFMTTDVSSGDRGNADAGGDGKAWYPTSLKAVADEWGVHFLFTYYDSRARLFEAGELNAGSYEGYLASAPGKPYCCFLCYPQKEAEAHVANYAYDSPGYRRPIANDPSKVRSDVRFHDDRIENYVAFSWNVYADQIPANGDTWEFEVLFWGPVPSAWNGTHSIHGRSTWGRIRFAIEEKDRIAILRDQLFKAANAYKAEKQPDGHPQAVLQEGVFDHWNDEAVGDQDFYRECLAPLEAELDAVVARIKVGMSDADVREIATRHLTRLRDIRFEVARLRDRYLEDMLMKGN